MISLKRERVPLNKDTHRKNKKIIEVLKKGMSRGFVLCCKGPASTLILRFKLKCLNSPKKTLRHTADGQYFPVDSRVRLNRDI